MEQFNKTILGVLAISLFSLIALQTLLGLSSQNARILGLQDIGRSSPSSARTTCTGTLKGYCTASMSCERGYGLKSEFFPDCSSAKKYCCIPATSFTKPLPSVTPTTVPKAIPVYYTKTTGWITADPNMAVTAPMSCNPGDTAISGGMDLYSGTINTWRTVKSSPEAMGESNSWVTTVINENSTPQQFTVTVRCHKTTL